MTDQPRSIPSWLPQSEITPAPVARSLNELAELAFRGQDALARADAEADKQRRRSHALDFEAMRDEAEHAQFMGRPVLSALEYHALVSAEADRRDEADRKHRQAKRIAAQERRIAELEAEVAEAAADRTRSTRTLRAANEAAAAFHRRAEQGAQFRRCVYCGVANGTPHNATCER